MRGPRHSRLGEALVVVALLLLPLLFWWRLWALDPADRAAIPEGDFTSQYYPLQLFAARELAAGRLPAWDPYINAGQPGLADPQTGAFYPPNLLLNGLLALSGLSYGVKWLQAQVVLHFSLASLFTYLLVRRLVRRTGAGSAAARFGGAVAALSFTYAGYLTSFPVQQLTILETAIWLPLVLFCLDAASGRTESSGGRVCSRWTTVHRLGAGLALACALLAGHPQTALYVVYATLAYGLFLSIDGRRRPAAPAAPDARWSLTGPLRCLARFACLALLPLVTGLALSAVQWVPTLEFILRSTRAGLDYEAVAWGFPLAEITHLLYPGYFGGSPQYVGILPPVLAVAALLFSRARREVRFWALLGAVAFLLALGGNTFLYDLAYLLAPGFGAVRDQERVIYLFSLAVAVLAGYGAAALAQPAPAPLRRRFGRFVRGAGLAFVAMLGLTALWTYGYLEGLQQGVQVNLFEGVLRHHALLLLILGGSALLLDLRRSGRVRRRWLMALALGLIGLNLFTVNGRYNLAEPATGGPFPLTELVAKLKSQAGTFRISSAGLLPGGSSAGIVYELEDITANTPLRLEAFQQLEDRAGAWRRWQLLNVHYVLGDRDLGGPGLEEVYAEGAVRVYRLSDPLPRAWVVHGVEVAEDGRAVDRLNAGDWDPRLTAVLPPGAGVGPLPGGTGSAAGVVEAAPGRLVLEVSPDREGLLVVSQPFYPGWRARVDGRPAPILRANLLLQAVPVGAGSHRVELTFRPSPWPGIVSLVAAAVCLGALGMAVCRRGRG